MATRTTSTVAARSKPPVRDVPPPSGGTSRPWPLARTAVAALCALVLAWAAWNVVTVDAPVGPVAGANRWMRTISSDAGFDPPSGRRAAHHALESIPIDGRASRALAQVAEAEGDTGQARALWAIAAARAPRDVITRARLTDMELARGRFDEGMAHLDALMRVSPRLRRPLLRVVAPHLGDADLRQALLARLANDPPWRSGLALELRGAGVAPDAAETLLGELATIVPLTPEELETRIRLLRQLDRPGEARQLWLAALPAELRSLEGQPFDGGFEGTATGGAYGWHWTDTPGTAVRYDRSSAHAGAQSLLLEFSGRETRLRGPSQNLQLAPGAYRLQAAADNRTGSPRPFQWEIRCGNQGLAQLPLATARGWSETAVDFDVPPDCSEQELQLRHLGRNLAERQLGGSLALDAVVIAPR